MATRRLPHVEALEARLLLAGGLTVTTDAPVVLPQMDTIGVNLVYTGDDNQNGAMTMRYRPAGASTWQDGQGGIRVFPTFNGTTSRREFATRLFLLQANTQYEVQVTFTDPDGVSGASSRTFTVQTLAEPLIANTGGHTYYVDPARATNGNGSLSTPWNNLPTAVASALAGDTVFLRGGEYVLTGQYGGVTFNNNGTATQPIIFKAYPGETPVIRGPKTGFQWDAGTTWTNEGATYPGVYSVTMAKGDKLGTAFYNDVFLGWCDSLSNLVLGKCRNPEDGLTYNTKTYGGWYYDATAGRLYVKLPQTWNQWSGPVINPAAGTVVAVHQGAYGFHGITINSQYLVLDGLTVEFLDKAIFIYASATNNVANNLTIRNCDFEHNMSDLYAYQQSGSTATRAMRNVLIDQCTFSVSPQYWFRDWSLGHSSAYDMGGISISDIPQATGTIRNSHFANSENAIFVGSWAADGNDHAEAVPGWVIENNDFFQIGDDPIEFEGPCYQDVAWGNTMRYTQSAISLAPAAFGPVWVIRNSAYQAERINPDGQPDRDDAYNLPSNVLKFNSGYDAAGPSITCVAYHNTFVFDTKWSGTACSGGFNHYACPDGLNFIGRNNSYVTLGYGTYTFLAEVAQAADSVQKFDMDYDSLYKPGYANTYYAGLWTTAQPTFTRYQALLDLRAAGYETHGVEVAAPYSDPAGGDFTVPVGTSLHDAGVYLPGIDDGYQGAAPDIGSYEAPGAAPPRYALNVVDGTGDGDYAAGTVVGISATIPPGNSFAAWTGDTAFIADLHAASTTLTMPDHAVNITATFVPAVYPVGVGQTYTTLQAAANAACAFDNSDAIIRVMDSGVYNEYVTVPYGEGNSSRTLTFEPAPGQTPRVYGFSFSCAFDTVVKGMTIDGTLRPYSTDPNVKDYLIYARYAGDRSFENCTFRSRGRYQTAGIYGDAGTLTRFRNDLFESTTNGIVSVDASDANGAADIEFCTFLGDSGIVWSRSNANGAITIDNNIFSGCRAAVYRRNSIAGTNITVEHNTFYQCGGATDYADGALVVRDFAAGNMGLVVKDNLFVGKGAASTQYTTINTYTMSTSAVNADYNGFYNMKQTGGVQQVAYLQGAWKSGAQFNAYSGASGNTVGTSNPFLDAANGDFRLRPDCWATTAASDGTFIGALPAVLPGDANGDGIVDQADYTVWYNHYGSAGTWALGDFTIDGLVDQADYTVWYNHYGLGGGSAGATVATQGDAAASIPAVGEPPALDVVTSWASSPLLTVDGLPKSLAPGGSFATAPTPEGAAVDPGASPRFFLKATGDVHRSPIIGRRSRGPVSRIDLGDTGVLDAKFLAEQLDLLRESVVLSCLPGARVQGVGRPAAGRHDSVLGQGDDMQNGGFHVSGPPRR